MKGLKNADNISIFVKRAQPKRPLKRTMYRSIHKKEIVSFLFSPSVILLSVE